MAEWFESGGGLIITAGDQMDLEAYWTTLGAGEEPLMPCNFVQPVGDALNHDRFNVLTTLDYDHPIFQPFKDPNHGDFEKGRFYRYIQAVPLKNSTVVGAG